MAGETSNPRIENVRAFLDRWSGPISALSALAGALALTAIWAGSVFGNLFQLILTDPSKDYIRSVIEFKFQTARIYFIKQEKEIEPLKEVAHYDLNCCPGDLPLGYNFDSTRQANVHLRTRFVKMNNNNGYNLSIFNDAAPTYGVQPVAVYSVCLEIVQSKCSSENASARARVER